MPASPQLREQFLQHNPIAVEHRRDRAEFDRELRRISDWLPRDRPLRVLDLGCGAGSWTGFWLEMGAQVVALDLYVDFVRVAAQRLADVKGRLYPTIGDAGRVPLASRSFDVVTANSLLEHTPHWQSVVEEAARLVAPGGVLMLHTTNRFHPFQTEVRNFPFFPWLPEGTRNRVLAWIMKHRPDLVAYTDLPAVNWFHPVKLKAFVAGLGLDVYERLELVRPEELHGVRALGRWMVSRDGRRVRGRALYYLLTKSVSLYAKRPA